MPQWMADYMQLHYETTGELESLAKEGQYRFAQQLVIALEAMFRNGFKAHLQCFHHA